MRTDPKGDWREIYKGLVSKDEWILGGNYGTDPEIRMKEKDTIFSLILGGSERFYQ